MTAEERAGELASALWDVDCPLSGEACEIVASAICDAENDALERAAKVLDATGANLSGKAIQLRPLLQTIAAGVRGLKSNHGGGR